MTQHTVQSRTYNLVSPSKSTNVPKPLLVVLHGGMGNAKTIEDTTGFTLLAEAQSFYAAYPEGTPAGTTPQLANKRTWNAGVCCGKAVSTHVNDVAWLSAVIADAQVRAGNKKIDPKRVYVTGMSNGAMMAYRMAVEAPALIAAAVIVAGTLAIDQADGAKLVPILHIHGSDDQNVPFLGGVGDDSATQIDYRSVLDTIDLLLVSRGTVNRENDAPQANVERSRWTCSSGGPIELDKIIGGIHTWPGAGPDPLKALDASAMCIDFCRRFRKGG